MDLLPLVEGVQGMAEILVFGQEKRRLIDVDNQNNALGSLQNHLARISGLQNGLGIFVTNLCMWVLLVLSIPMVVDGDIEGVYLAVVVLAALSSFEAVLPLPQAAQILEGNLFAASRLNEVVSVEPEVIDPVDPYPIPDRLDIHVKELCFSYPDTDSQLSQIKDINVLRDISFRLNEGGSLAVVGPSGTGKSTLINLVLRFYYFHRGKIVVGGNDLRKYNSYRFRDVLAVVAQDSYIFNATVQENLLVARPSATDAEIFAAARAARIHEVIMRLPEGYQTRIGEWGMRMSGGERQRLIIARAYLKDARLILLDEATAHLDVISESKVLEALHDLSRTRSVLIATHRLVGLDKIDEILVLKEGQIVEQGTHQGLLQKRGYYYQMWQIQNQQLA